ncbi:MAG: ribosome silencing factor [Actinobacteria bacterium]|jgi:ribosome-associated protein|nr:ribosome silencing factor [Actinomycetota bacterium]
MADLLKVASTAMIAANAAAGKTEDSVVIMEMGEVSYLADTFIVASARNARQVRAVTDEVERCVKQATGSHPVQVEGLDDCKWVLMDYGDVIVHIFDRETRAFYDIEDLWGDVPRRVIEEDRTKEDRTIV